MCACPINVFRERERDRERERERERERITFGWWHKLTWEFNAKLNIYIQGIFYL